MWLLKQFKYTNEPIYGKETDSQTQKQTCGCQGGEVGGGQEMELGLANANHCMQDG